MIEKAFYLACALLSDKGYAVTFCENEVSISRGENEKCVINKSNLNFDYKSSYEFQTEIVTTLLPLFSLDALNE